MELLAELQLCLRVLALGAAALALALEAGGIVALALGGRARFLGAATVFPLSPWTSVPQRGQPSGAASGLLSRGSGAAGSGALCCSMGCKTISWSI